MLEKGSIIGRERRNSCHDYLQGLPRDRFFPATMREATVMAKPLFHKPASTEISARTYSCEPVGCQVPLAADI